MNPLQHHIEYLLQSESCVAIPQFGAFVAMDCSASYVETEELFFPPQRSVRFNPSITEDDGILVNYVTHKEHCNVNQAKHQIQSWVLDLRQQLLAESQVDFGSLGVFTQDEDGHVTFSACQSGITLPAHFGLDVISVARIKNMPHRHKMHTNHNADNNTITIRINRRALHSAVAVAACFLFCLLFSSPLGEATHPKCATVFQVPEMTTFKASQAAQPVVAPTELTEEPSTQESIPSEQVSKPLFAIIVASATSQKNAEYYVQDLQKRGYSNAHIYNNGHILRVVIDDFSSETAAYNYKNLLQDSEEFAAAWVLTL